MARFLMAALTSGLLVMGMAARTQAPPQPTPTRTYVGADACKDCHADQYGAWSKTKHARALAALSSDERQISQCMKCHVTGSPETLAAEGATPSRPNVQCEACHGPASLHVEAAKAGNAKSQPMTAIEEKTCTRCHSQESPHFKYFYYEGMKSFVHPKGSH
jgi:hypothetical protein